MFTWRWRLAGLMWVAGVVTGFAILLRYNSTPGERAESPMTWPNHTNLHRSTDVATLLLFAHPKCSCTRASLAELRKLIDRVHDKVSAQVVLIRPNGTTPDWEQSELGAIAATIPGVSVIAGGEAEATRFGVITSGTSLLYGPNGRLLFAGGITSSRGHEGDNLGSERIVSLLTTGHADRQHSPVFGCTLYDSPGGVLHAESNHGFE